MDDFEDNYLEDDLEGNLLVEDDALDYILYDEMEKDSGNKKKYNNGNKGCAVIFLVSGGAISTMIWGGVKLINTIL